jgi:hypothetical protein
LESFQNPKNIPDERLERFKAVAGGHKHDDCDRQGLQVLLEFDVLVGGQQRVELGGGLPKKRSVAQSGPTHLSDGADVVACQQVRQRSG